MGMIFLLSSIFGRDSDVPVMSGTLGPWTSASRSPTRSPRDLRASARLTATVDFPTPPLPLATAMIDVMPGSGSRALRARDAAADRSGAVHDRDLDLDDAGQRGDGSADLGLQRRDHFALARGKIERDRDVSVAHRDILDQSKGYDVAGKPG